MGFCFDEGREQEGLGADAEWGAAGWSPGAGRLSKGRPGVSYPTHASGQATESAVKRTLPTVQGPRMVREKQIVSKF